MNLLVLIKPQMTLPATSTAKTRAKLMRIAGGTASPWSAIMLIMNTDKSAVRKYDLRLFPPPRISLTTRFKSSAIAANKAVDIRRHKTKGSF